MRILIDIKHPAEVRFFSPLIRGLKARNDIVLVTAHYKPHVPELMSALGIDHVRISNVWSGPVGIVGAAFTRTLKMLRIARRFHPHVMLARVGVEIGATGRILGVPAISFDENEYATLQLMLSRSLAHVVCTGMGYEKSLGIKQLRFNALPQLVYTHPARFTPDRKGLKAAGLNPDEPYVVVRLGCWHALHDIGHRGASEREALELVKRLGRHARVVLSRAGGLPPLLERYGLSIPAEQALHLLAFARLYVGEGGSMAAEAACLGTPGIWMSPIRCGYLNVLTHRYGLIEQTTDLEEVYKRAVRWLNDPAMRAITKQGHQRLLDDSDDPVEFMLEVVDRYALSG